MPKSKEDHYPSHCKRCGSALELWFTYEGASAHIVLDLERQAAGVRVACIKHRYFAVVCACGAKTPVRPLTGAVSIIEGRKDQLRPSEASLVGPGLTTFIAALLVRYRMSRAKIAEFLSSWLDVRLYIGVIDRYIREADLASAPIVDGLIDELRAAGVIHADETSWPQQGQKLRWLWVALSSTTAIYRISGRHAETIRTLIGDAFIGVLVSDGYGAYRSYPRRQSCVAHLIRKGIALNDGYQYQASRFGEWLVCEMRALSHTVSENRASDTAAAPGSVSPILARLKRACLLTQDADAEKGPGLWYAKPSMTGTPPPPSSRIHAYPQRIMTLKRRCATRSSSSASAIEPVQIIEAAPTPLSSLSSRLVEGDGLILGQSSKKP